MSGQQTRLDSFTETLVNTAVGYLVAMVMHLVVIAPLFDLQTTMGENAAIVALFTIASIIRQYTIRRLFDGRSVYHWMKEALAS